MDVYAPAGADDDKPIECPRFVRRVVSSNNAAAQSSPTNRLLLGDGIKRQLCENCQDLQTRKVEMLRAFDAPELSDVRNSSY
jgi:hypothetical protein